MTTFRSLWWSLRWLLIPISPWSESIIVIGFDYVWHFIALHFQLSNKWEASFIVQDAIGHFEIIFPYNTLISDDSTQIKMDRHPRSQHSKNLLFKSIHINGQTLYHHFSDSIWYCVGCYRFVMRNRSITNGGNWIRNCDRNQFSA